MSTSSPHATSAAAQPTATVDDARTPHERFFAAGRAQTLDEHDAALWESLREQTRGGKRFRPALVTQTYAALGGQNHHLAATVGDAVELLHTAFVLHDDVIDRDQVRRGRPNVMGTFVARARTASVTTDQARHYGETAGILAGDLALAGAVREIALCGAAPAVTARLLDLLEEVLHRSAAGELGDVRLSLTADSSMVETLAVAEWKTAAYSFQLPLQAAGILAGTETHVIAALSRVGRSVGTAFQLRDDLAGTFGTAGETGKDPLGDLREGKHTALIAAARPTGFWPELGSLIGDPDLTPEDATRARDLLETCGARAEVESRIRDLCRDARVTLADLPTPVADVLGTLIEQLVPSTSSARTPHPVADRAQGPAVRGAA